MLLGDGLAAVVVESAQAASLRGAEALAVLAGWGRAGDAFHVVQPHPEGTGLARAITAALDRGKVAPAEIGYINANGSGTAFADASEAAAIHRALETAAGWSRSARPSRYTGMHWRRPRWSNWWSLCSRCRPGCCR